MDDQERSTRAFEMPNELALMQDEWARNMKIMNVLSDIIIEQLNYAIGMMTETHKTRCGR